MPFTVEQFFGVFAAYNRSVWPGQIGLLFVGLLLSALAFKRRGRDDGVITGGLALLWIWMAVVYHWMFFRAINSAATLFSALFLIQGALFLFHRPIGEERPGQEDRIWPGLAMIGYAFVLYPIIGWLLGHRYPATPTFGLPCPTTIATFGILSWSSRPARWWLLVVPTIWSLIATGAALGLGIYQDLGLPAAAMLFWVLRWQSSRARTRVWAHDPLIHS